MLRYVVRRPSAATAAPASGFGLADRGNAISSANSDVFDEEECVMVNSLWLDRRSRWSVGGGFRRRKGVPMNRDHVCT